MPFGGTWTVTDPPRRAGTFINVEQIPTPRPIPDTAGVVGIVAVSEWGPENVITDISSEAEGQFWFNTSGTMDFTITQALRGEARPGRSGASLVKAYRAVASAGANATRTIANTTPATALTLTAKYKGTRANSFTVTVQANAINASNKDILIYEGTVLRERYNDILQTDTVAMAAAINAESNLVTAASNITGVALANIASSAFSGGVSGSTLTSTEHTAAQDAFEADGGFSVFAVDALTDGTIRGLYRTWVEEMNEEGKTMMMVIGGAASETAATALTRADGLDSPFIAAIQGDVTIDSVSYSSAQLASRVAGLIAGAGIGRPITFGRIDEGRMTSPPASSVQEELVANGVIPFWADARGVRLQDGVTTLQTLTTDRPEEFREILYVRKAQEYFRRIDEVATDAITDGFNNTEPGRASLLSVLQNVTEQMIREGAAIPGSTVYLDPGFDNTGKAIHLVFAVEMTTGVSQLLGRLTLAVPSQAVTV